VSSLLLSFLFVFPLPLIVFPDVVLVSFYVLPVSATFTVVFMELSDSLIELLFTLSCLLAICSEFLDVGLILVAKSRDMRLVGPVFSAIFRNVGFFPSDIGFILSNGIICVLGESSCGYEHSHKKDAQKDTQVPHVYVNSFSFEDAPMTLLNTGFMD
jgi:hypothetical protein